MKNKYQRTLEEELHRWYLTEVTRPNEKRMNKKGITCNDKKKRMMIDKKRERTRRANKQIQPRRMSEERFEEE